MTSSERVRVGELWIGLAAMYGRELQNVVLKIMLDAIQDLPVQKVEKAFNQWAVTSKLNRHPLPADIHSIVNPEIDPDSIAREASARIGQAIVKFGWCNAEEARAFIGELGWRVVERFGGWPYLCEHHGLEINPSTFTAQARDLAKSQLDFESAGLDFTEHGPSLVAQEKQLLVDSQRQAAGIIAQIGRDGERSPTPEEAKQILDKILEEKKKRALKDWISPTVTGKKEK